MNDIEYKKQQRRDINRRAYLRRINGDVKNYSKNSDNDYKYIKFLKQKGKIQDKEQEISEEETETDNNDIYWSSIPEKKDRREETDLSHWLNPDNMRKRDEEFDKRFKAQNMAQITYKPQFNTGFPYLV